MQKKASIEDFSETEINNLTLTLSAGYELANLEIENNTNKITNNLEYENEKNSINIIHNLLEANEENKIKQFYKYVTQIFEIKQFHKYAVQILGKNLSLEFNVLSEHIKMQFLVETAKFFIQSNAEFLGNLKNAISSFQNPIRAFLLPFLNDLCCIEPSKFAIETYNNLFENLPLSINSSSYNIEVENLLIANMFNICEHYCSEREKSILNGYRIYKPEFKHLKLLFQKKRTLVKKFNNSKEAKDLTSDSKKFKKIKLMK